MDPERITAALECIDDDIGLVHDQPISAAELWREVIREAAGDCVDSLVVVCPTWWPSHWVDRVYDAAVSVATAVVVLTRAEVLRDEPSTVLVELASEFVAVSLPGGFAALPRRDTDDAARAVAETVGCYARVLVDVPDGVDDGPALGEAVIKLLRAEGVSVSIVEPGCVRRVAFTPIDEHEPQPVRAPHRNRRRGIAVLSVAALCGGFAVHKDVPVADVIPMTLLVEGRVGVMVPAQWTVQRITSGPGSARVQVISPSHADIVVHITQSVLAQQAREMVVETLRNALAEQPGGVFVDFNPAGVSEDKRVVTYRELRGDRRIEWMVLVDKNVRIAIGCQSAAGHEQLVRDACERAVRSAHAVF